MICTTCNGAKKQTVKVVEYAIKGRSESSFTLTCVVCRGKGEISDAQYAALQYEKTLWCRCGNPTGNVTYHDDNEHGAAYRKHHWTCDDCSKVTQIG